jgi:tryptophan halogenase
MKPVKHVLIVGGGTAGWLTAAFLARTLAARSDQGVRISLVEASDVGIIGVGEATFPSIKGTLAAIGIGEAQFLRESNGTFKQGINFVNWVRPGGTAGPEAYFHPFSLPSQQAHGPELLPYWLMGGAGPGVAFAEAVTLQKRVAEAARGPKRLGDAEFQGPLNYAYHLDAAGFAAMLGRHAQSLGVAHVVATVDRVELDADGAIAAVVTREKGPLRADLYIDCTGFRAALIGGALASPFRGLNDTLFNDRAVALQVPYGRPDAPIAAYTISTAQEAGWIWDIGLQQRRGVGYVYSSRYTDETRAESVLRAHIGPASNDLVARHLRLNVGWRDRQWLKNCVAVGLSGGFVEPLESSGIGLIETAAYLIGFLFPFGGDMEPVARRFNTFMTERYKRIADFIKLHYCLSQRRDTPFWRDNTDSATVPESLREKLAMWRHRPPHRLDFDTDLEMYQPASWQYVLYGMEYRTDIPAAQARFPRMAEAGREFAMIREVSQRALADLPTHRALVTGMTALSQAA